MNEMKHMEAYGCIIRTLPLVMKPKQPNLHSISSTEEPGGKKYYSLI